MNAAARLVHQGVLSKHLLLNYFLTRRQLIMFALILAVLLSALSLIYVTHSTRVLTASYQHQLTEKNRLHVKSGQLLLERSTLMMQARIQQSAENELDMVIPNHKSVVIIQE